jgi:hypothetical protein
MKTARLLRLSFLGLSLLIAGCIYAVPSSVPGPSTRAVSGLGVAAPGDEQAAKEAKIRDNLVKLGPEDQKLAEAQKYCAIESENRLGSPEMGPPVKIMVKDQPVFLCCKMCAPEAQKDPDKTLAKVAKLKEKAAEEAKKK